MRNGNFKITLHMSQFKSPHLRGDLGHFELKKKLCLNNIYLNKNLY